MLDSVEENRDEDSFLNRDRESYVKSVDRIRNLVSEMNGSRVVSNVGQKRLHVVCHGDASKLEGGNIRVDIPGLTKVRTQNSECCTVVGSEVEGW